MFLRLKYAKLTTDYLKAAQEAAVDVHNTRVVLFKRFVKMYGMAHRDALFVLSITNDAEVAATTGYRNLQMKFVGQTMMLTKS